MLVVSLAALLGTQTTAPAPRVLVLALDPIGVAPTLAQSIDPLVASAAGTLTNDVMSEADLKQLAEMEANKASMGCDTSSCLAEIAGAMGAELVLYGTVSQLGTSTVVTLSLFDSKASTIRRDVLTTSTLDTLPHEVPRRVSKLMLEARPVLANRAGKAAETQPSEPAPAAEAPTGAGFPWLAIGVLGAGVLVAGTGTALVVVNELSAGTASLDAKDKESAQLWGRVGIGVAAAGLVVAGIGGVLLAGGGGE
jgi:hypothetical protein